MHLDPHEEFLEFCALSTTGELSAEEEARLESHLLSCARCREAKSQYEGIVSETIPALAAEANSREDDSQSSYTWSLRAAEERLLSSLPTETTTSRRNAPSPSKLLPLKSFVIGLVAATLLAGSSTAAYRIGLHRSSLSATSASATKTGVVPTVFPTPPVTLPGGTTSDKPAPSAVPNTMTTETEFSVDSHAERAQRAALGQKQHQLEAELAARTAALEQVTADRDEIDRQLAIAVTSEKELQEQRENAATLNSQEQSHAQALALSVKELMAALEQKDRKIADTEALLQHDKDIRNLMGARDLYIADIYDVARTGETQKAFGRVFYTRDKSLVFYGYDLDQGKGANATSTFQVWGRRGSDQKHAVSLGILYQDGQDKKRWLLKSSDATTLSQLDALFVTVEPKGGSAKPSGKPLLSTYLRLDPNHP